MLNIKTFTFNPFSENTYILYNENKEAFLIDPGNMQDFETKDLLDFIISEGLNIKNILLTHAHIDHILGLQWAYDTFKVPVLLHEIDKELLDKAPQSALRFGFDFKVFAGEVAFLSNENVISLGEDVVKVLFVPGHSPGSIAFYSEKDKFVISGDVLFYGSIGRTDLYKSDYDQLIESIKTELFVLNDEVTVYSGHGQSTTIGFEKAHNPFLK